MSVNFEMSNPRWFAIYVRSRHEKRVADHLASRGVERFLPQYISDRKWADRRIKIALPLFPGYLFVRIRIDHRMQVLESPGVIYMVGVSGRPAALEDEEIEQMKMVCATLNPLPHTLTNVDVGDRVRVIRGPLAGYTGYLLRTKKGRVVLVQELTRQAFSVEVEMDAIVPETQACCAQDGAAEARAAQGLQHDGKCANGRVQSMLQISEKPHTNARQGARVQKADIPAAAIATSAPGSQHAPTGDPFLGDVGPGVCPPRPPASSVGTPNRS